MKKKLAVFTSGWCTEILSQFLTGMMDMLNAEEADIFLFLCYPTPSDTEATKNGEMNIFNLPDLHDFDGTVIFGSGIDYQDRNDDIIARSRAAGIPVVMQGGRREGVCYVGSDNYKATQDMCAHLISEHGVKKIVFFAGTPDSYDSELRLKALRDYLKENDLEDHLTDVYYTNWEMAEASRLVDEICASGRGLPDAFICANDGLAQQTCVTLDSNGYDVPGDILVTGYDYTKGARVFYPSISSVDQCFVEMGEAAIKLWKEQLVSGGYVEGEVIPCKFIPGESCGCHEHGSSDELRRRVGREAFSGRAANTYFTRKLDVIDSTILSCHTYDDFKVRLNALLRENHTFEGDSFHVILEPNLGLSIYDSDIKLNTDRYSKHMDVLYSYENGVGYAENEFCSKDLIPGYTGEGTNHLYAFVPLHESDLAFGYLVFRDCIDKVENRFLHVYSNRMSVVIDKFRHTLALDLINKRLIDLMRRDPLTNVNNRIAFDEKEKFMQSQINSGENVHFAVAMFDVNSLKLINDTYGHESGDEYLIRACRLICNVFKHSPVYRMGGDEFVAILAGKDYDNRESLIKLFNESLSPYTESVPLPPDYISVAIGVSAFDPETDLTIADVNKRADEAMYKDKGLKKDIL